MKRHWKASGKYVQPIYLWNICRSFRVVDDFNEYYYEGMYQLAVDRKEL